MGELLIWCFGFDLSVELKVGGLWKWLLWRPSWLWCCETLVGLRIASVWRNDFWLGLAWLRVCWLTQEFTKGLKLVLHIFDNVMGKWFRDAFLTSEGLRALVIIPLINVCLLFYLLIFDLGWVFLSWISCFPFFCFSWFFLFNNWFGVFREAVLKWKALVFNSRGAEWSISREPPFRAHIWRGFKFIELDY